MKRPKVDLLVLGARGVVFSNSFCDFLDRIATKTGQSPVKVRDRWHRELRLPTWTGELRESELWQRLIKGLDCETTSEPATPLARTPSGTSSPMTESDSDADDRPNHTNSDADSEID